MTTYTKLAEGEQATISIYPERKLSKINDNIYGGFTEHMGRCIYGGLYDPDNTNKELIDENGFRKDVIEALQELRVPVVRYPGGRGGAPGLAASPATRPGPAVSATTRLAI